MLDRKGQRFAEVFEENERRAWIALDDIPEQVRRAFIAAEDGRFYEHRGIDERGLIRAFIGNLAGSRRPQGGSTITQQVVKNLLVGEELTYDRKIREMIVASRLEGTLSKDRILELYLNMVYLGRGAWGIDMAARSYFGKSAKELTLEEGALLAGLTKGPNYYSPDRHPARARERLAYVFGRMQEDGAIGPDRIGRRLPDLPALVAYEKPRRDFGFHFVDQVVREAKQAAGISAITSDYYTVRSTIDQKLQRVVEQTLQEGLSRYERSAGRVSFRSAEANLAKAIRRIEARRVSSQELPAWQQALAGAWLALYDVHWTPAVVLEKPTGKKGASWKVGLADGRILPLSVDNAGAQRKLAVHDVVFVKVTSNKGGAASAELRVRPLVQGAVVVLENATGRILAMSGGFSYPLSQLNRATQAMRQPGSAIKPLSYLAALGKGLQPNTLIKDDPITLSTGRDRWSPENYDGGGGGTLTLQKALENSRNLATVRLLDGGIEKKPEASVERLCALAEEAGIYRECQRYYSAGIGRAAGATDRSGGVLCGDRERGDASRAARHRQHRAGRPHDLPPPAQAGRDRLGRPRLVLSAQVHAAGGAGARHRTIDGGDRAVRGRQDRHLRRGERRLVRGLQQRRDGGGVGRLRQCRRQAAHARRRRDRRTHRGSDLRAGHAGGMGACRRKGGAGAAVIGGEASALVHHRRQRRRETTGNRGSRVPAG